MINTYYKISPEWYAKLPEGTSGIEHPDGWFMLLPTTATKLLEILPMEEIGHLQSLDDVVRHIGGCVYNHSEVMQSQLGNPDYMMNREPEKVTETPSEDLPHDKATDTLLPAESKEVAVTPVGDEKEESENDVPPLNSEEDVD